MGVGVPLPDYLKEGESARLFPIGSLSNKERRATSTLLAILPIFPELASELLSSISERPGKRAVLSAYTEVVFKNSDNNDRPDGLLIVEQSKKTFTALIEAKVDKKEIERDQLERYLKIAADNGIDAVITISNQFVSSPTISPVEKIPKQLLRKTKLFHWSWTSVITQFELLRYNKSVDDREKLMLLEELIRYFDHPTTGIETFTQMKRGWKDVVRTVSTGSNLSANDNNVKNSVDAWIQEERDLSLLLSRKLSQPVASTVPRALQGDQDARRKVITENLIKDHQMTSIFRIPDAADDLTVTADLARKSISVKMSLRAPEDRKSTSARVNWLLRQLDTDDARINIRANWKSKVKFTQEPISMVRSHPDCLQTENQKSSPVSFDILLIDSTGTRFSSRKQFIEDLERIVLEFYKIIGGNLSKWQKKPPKIESRKSETVELTNDDRKPEMDVILSGGEDLNTHEKPPTEDNDSQSSVVSLEISETEEQS